MRRTVVWLSCASMILFLPFMALAGGGEGETEEKVRIVEKEKIDGDTAVCNLASVNLSRVNTKEDIDRIVPIAIRALDNVIDLNFYPLEKVKRTNMKTRAIGLGVMGEAQMLAQKGI